MYSTLLGTRPRSRGPDMETVIFSPKVLVMVCGKRCVLCVLGFPGGACCWKMPTSRIDLFDFFFSGRLLGSFLHGSVCLARTAFPCHRAQRIHFTLSSLPQACILPALTRPSTSTRSRERNTESGCVCCSIGGPGGRWDGILQWGVRYGSRFRCQFS